MQFIRARLKENPATKIYVSNNCLDHIVLSSIVLHTATAFIFDRNTLQNFTDRSTQTLPATDSIGATI